MCCTVSRQCAFCDCEKECGARKNELKQRAVEVVFPTVKVSGSALSEKSCTHVGHNQKSLPLLPCGCRPCFHVFVCAKVVQERAQLVQ